MPLALLWADGSSPLPGDAAARARSRAVARSTIDLASTRVLLSFFFLLLLFLHARQSGRCCGYGVRAAGGMLPYGAAGFSNRMCVPAGQWPTIVAACEVADGAPAGLSGVSLLEVRRKDRAMARVARRNASISRQDSRWSRARRGSSPRGSGRASS